MGSASKLTSPLSYSEPWFRELRWEAVQSVDNQKENFKNDPIHRQWPRGRLLILSNSKALFMVLRSDPLFIYKLLQPVLILHIFHTSLTNDSNSALYCSNHIEFVPKASGPASKTLAGP